MQCQKKRIESTWYETSPFVYAAVGVAAAMRWPDTMLMKASSMMLVVAALTIIGLRWIYRHDVVRREPLDEGRYVTPITEELFYERRER